MTAALPIALLEQRLSAGRQLLERHGFDAIVAFSAPRGLAAATQTSGNIGWFTNFTPMWAPSMLVITATDAVIVAPGKNEARLFTTRVGELYTVEIAGPAGLVTRASAIAHANRWRVGVAGADEMTAKLAATFASSFPRMVRIDPLLQAMRLDRDPAETALHRRASEISDAMLARAFAYAAEPDATPARLMAEVEHAGRSLGADVSRLWLSTGPEPPVTYFEMFELPSAIAPGDRVQLGTMVSYEGYFAQGLRIGSRGNPAPELIDAAAHLIDIQDAALAALVPGRPVHELVDLLEATIDRLCPYARDSDPFRFQSCHGLGLDYSEPGLAEALSPRRDRSRDADRPLLRPGMVFEIHPNFTLPGLGHVCAGDVALVTESGAEWLTRFPRGIFRID
ncbi:MAG: aminopeptidase P family protein [Devosia sp.]|nr:aminopeptidase P family protein [Devosia sp.]